MRENATGFVCVLNSSERFIPYAVTLTGEPTRIYKAVGLKVQAGVMGDTLEKMMVSLIDSSMPLQNFTILWIKNPIYAEGIRANHNMWDESIEQEIREEMESMEEICRKNLLIGTALNNTRILGIAPKEALKDEKTLEAYLRNCLP